ncbi:putative hemolysin [Thermosporothrix hazakensis]|jgi:putative hemolysin|uniref:Hemolysin n=2 Tax=Thermosporothrix TaxID=768650 RepID=A0A455SMJ6_9CHLR|nr:hemolysin family protein [Thermosporothrix hazakensis]PZW36404.1 putative hemolysin [Thermosporothrix hazakensis]BBH88870.1 hypothetical protein KTC_36210 [Thermosporothrix sp. COM3]GCE47055.1 hypothetical protein KTH_19240 [Thermosporothrix hazakensis]
MPGFPIVEVIIIFVLILANGFFAASEIAIVSARRSRLQQQANAGKKSAEEALNLAEDPDRFLATVQVGITLISTLSAAYGGASISDWLSRWLVQVFPSTKPYAAPISLGIVVVLITYFSLLIGELVPKRIALQSAEKIATIAAPIMRRLSIIASPIVAFLTVTANIVLRLVGQQTARKQEITEEDIVYLAREGAEIGTVESREEEFINRVFRFTDRSVGSVKVPRTEIVAVEVGTPFDSVIETFLSSGYTRLPLYEETLDNIVGVLYAKDLLRARSKDEPVDLVKLARPPFFISEYQHVDDLLQTFRSKGIHLAIVIDEYSQVTGLVTLEDLLEELVGEIQDEYDQPEESGFVQREDGSWLVDAMIDQELVRKKFNMPPVPDEKVEYKTLAGMILTHMGKIPAVGDKLTIDNISIEIMDMDGRRIDKVLIRQTAPEATDKQPTS